MQKKFVCLNMETGKMKKYRSGKTYGNEKKRLKGNKNYIFKCYTRHLEMEKDLDHFIDIYIARQKEKERKREKESKKESEEKLCQEKQS